jgi:hypothetical protein
MFIGYSTKYRSIIEELIPENQLRGAFIINGEKGKLKILFTLTPENPALIQEYRLSVVK